jgi:hypothetical protein
MWPSSDPPSDASSLVDAFYDPVDTNDSVPPQPSPQQVTPSPPTRNAEVVEGPVMEPPSDFAHAPSPKGKLSRSLKGKDKEWTAVAEKKRPLQLLDLPLDILREIISQVSIKLKVS